MASYAPYPLAVAQDLQGRWHVTVSVSPWQHCEITIIQQGITPEHAAELAMEVLPITLKGRTRQ